MNQDKHVIYEDWDCPDAIRMDALKGKMSSYKTLLSQESTAAIDAERGAIRKSIHLKSTEQTTSLEHDFHITDELRRGRFLFVDGFLMFHDPEIVSQFDRCIFIDVDYTTAKQRRQSRVYSTDQGSHLGCAIRY